MMSSRFKIQDSRFKQAGVTLLLAVLVLSGIVLVALAVGTFTIQEIRASRAITVTEPALDAAETGAEQALWTLKRNSVSSIPDCSGTSTTQNLSSSNSTLLYCKNYSGKNFTLVANQPSAFYLYDPNNPGGDSDLSGYPYSTLTITNQSNTFSVNVTVTRLDGTPVTSTTVNPNSTTTPPISLPAAAPGTEGRMQVTMQSIGAPIVYVTTDKGLPDVVNLNASGCSSRASTSSCNSTTSEIFTRKVQISLDLGTSSSIGTNVALDSNGGVASASSTHFSGLYLPAYANNGDEIAPVWASNGGWADNTASTFPDWLQIDFAGSKTINQIKVVTIQDNFTSPVQPDSSTTFSVYGITAFDVQYYNGSSWVTIPGGSVTGNNHVIRTFSFSPITTSKIRLVVNDAADHLWSRVVELEAFTP